MILKTLGDLKKALNATTMPRLIIIAAEDDYRRDLARKMIYNMLCTIHSEVNALKHFVAANFCWDELLNDNAQGSLFASFNLVECNNPDNKFPRPAGKIFNKWLESNNSNSMLLVFCSKLTNAQMNTAWGKNCANNGAILRLWPISFEQLPTWINETANQMQLKLSRDASLMLASATEGNLLATWQCLEKLRLCYGSTQIDESKIRPMLATSGSFNAFDWIDSALAGNAVRSYKIFKQLHSAKTEPLMLLGAILKTIRDCINCSAQNAAERSSALNKFWPSRRQLLQQATSRLDLAEWYKLLIKAMLIDAALKGQNHLNTAQAWLFLNDLALNIAGKKSLELHND